MKKLSDLTFEDPNYGGKLIEEECARQNAIDTIQELLHKYKNINFRKIIPIGKIDTGDIQIRVPTDLKDVPIIKLVGYLMWFYELDWKDIK
jgi:hypothetical protein